MSHAIVIGGSIAGMCAAAALSEQFATVTVLERGAAPTGEARATVPQTRHPHIIYLRGQQAIERILPGVFENMRARGALVGDFGERVRWFHSGSWRPNTVLGVDTWMFSRPLLELCVHDRLVEHANVDLRFECPVDAPIHSNGRVRGVRLRDGEQLEADLVVDATGRGSRSPSWLSEWGYGDVKEERAELGITYMTSVLEVGDAMGDTLGIMIHPDVLSNGRGGIAFRVEHGRVMLTLFGYEGECPPDDIEGYTQWAKTLMRPELHALLSSARVCEPLRKHTMPFQRRRRYDAMRMPAGYLIMGDALCSLDPTFGQGMTVAAMEAEQLARLRPGSARAMQRRLVRLTHLPWKMTAGEAQRACGHARPMSWVDAAVQGFFARAFVLAGHDVEIYATMSRIMNFVASPLALIPALVRGFLRSSADRGSADRDRELSHAPCLAELSSSSMTHGIL